MTMTIAMTRLTGRISILTATIRIPTRLSMQKILKIMSSPMNKHAMRWVMNGCTPKKKKMNCMKKTISNGWTRTEMASLKWRKSKML